MVLSRTAKILAAVVTAATLVGSVDDAFAVNNQYSRTDITGIHRLHPRYRHHGIGIGGAVAGAALGLAGVAATGVAADRYYNGYPAYSYGERQPPRYGYDYVPDHGYYGPY